MFFLFSAGTVMLRFVAGVCVGVWLGLYYDCEPHIAAVREFVLAHVPRPR